MIAIRDAVRATLALLALSCTTTSTRASMQTPSPPAESQDSLPSADAVSKQVLTTDSSGNATVQLPPSSAAAKVLNGLVIPHWIGVSDRFWYRRELSDGQSEFRVVDAASGASHAAFDAKMIAAGLSRAGLNDAKASSLPFSSFEFIRNNQAITFEAATTRYECELKKPACARRDQGAPGLSVSPDKRHALLVRDGDLYLRDLASVTDRALSSGGSKDNGFGIYPDGWKAAYIPRAKSKSLLPPLGALWSPDSARVLISHTDQREVKPYPFIEYAPDDGSFRPRVYNVRIPLIGEPTAKFEWYIAALADASLTRIEFPYEQLLELQQDLLAIRKTWWSHDGKSLFAVAFGSNMEAAYLFKVDATTGKVSTLISERDTPRADLNSTSYNPPNVRIVDDGREIIWFSQRDGWGHLYLYDGLTGALKTQITHGDWLVRDIIEVDAAQQLIYFTGSGREPGDPYYRFLYRVGFDGRGLTLLTPEPMDHLITGPENDVLTLDGAVSYEVLSPSRKYLVYNTSTLLQPPAAVIRTSMGKPVATFEHADVSALLATGYRPPRSVTLRAADGVTPLWGVLYPPMNLDEKARYPVIDAQYGSPLTAVVPHNFMSALNVPTSPQPAALAHEGFAAVVIDARGTTYRSKVFSNAMQGKLGTMNLEDHLAAIDELAKTYPWLDTERLGIIGGSYGGWVTLRAMLGYPERYKAGVALVPPGGMHNMYVDYHWTAFQGEPRYANGTNRAADPADIPLNWQSLNANAEAERLRGKLLVIMGALDENAIPGSTMQFIDALMKANKEFDLIYEPQANHYSTPNAYTQARSITFLKKSLGEVRH